MIARPSDSGASADWELVVEPGAEFLRGIDRAWSDLLGPADGCLDVFRSPQWFRVLGADGGSGLAVAVRRDRAGNVLGLCPLELRATDLSVYARGRRLWKAERSFASVLGEEPLGALESPEVLFGLVRAVRSWGRAQGLKFCVHSAGSPLAAAVTAVVARDWSVVGTPVVSLPFHRLTLPESFEAYLARHSAKRRYNHRRELRLLADGVGPVRLVPARAPDEVVRAAELVGAARRRAATDEDRAFCEHAACLLGARSLVAAAGGLFHSHLLMCADRVAAVIWGLEFRGTVVVRALYSNPQFRSYSPGSAANYLFLRALLERDPLDRPTRVVYGYGVVNAAHHHLNEQRVHTEHRLAFGGLRVRTGERLRGLLRSAVAASKRTVRQFGRSTGRAERNRPVGAEA